MRRLCSVWANRGVDPDRQAYGLIQADEWSDGNVPQMCAREILWR